MATRLARAVRAGIGDRVLLAKLKGLQYPGRVSFFFASGEPPNRQT